MKFSTKEIRDTWFASRKAGRFLPSMEVYQPWVWTCCNPFCSFAQTGLLGFLLAYFLAVVTQRSIACRRSSAQVAQQHTYFVEAGFSRPVRLAKRCAQSGGSSAAGARNVANLQGHKSLRVVDWGLGSPQQATRITLSTALARSPTARGADPIPEG